MVSSPPTNWLRPSAASGRSTQFTQRIFLIYWACAPRSLRLRVSHHESIANPSYRQKMFRLGGIVFNILPQTYDEVIDGPRVGILVEPPHIFKNCLPRHNIAFMLNEVTQQLRFHQS